MFRNLARLPRYRGLIQSLVARELKARYRGSVLGFFWSFINPLLLLLVYTFVFKFVMPASHDSRIEPYALFMFCGILPWTWFSSSLAESAGVLISGGNLIKKVLFPAEILPIVTVLANMVHFFFGLVILAGFLAWYQRPLSPLELTAFPLVVLVQLILTLGFALILSALTVHFRDIRDILSNLLTFWFFATPIIYPYFIFDDPANPGHIAWQGQLLKLNPFTHLAISYQEILFFPGPFGHLVWLLVLGAISIVWLLFGYFIFDDPANPGHIAWQGQLLKLNPFTHLAISYQEILFFPGPFGHLVWLLVLGAISIVWLLFGYFIFDRLRDTFAEEV